jgi:hypothetical protein
VVEGNACCFVQQLASIYSPFVRKTLWASPIDPQPACWVHARRPFFAMADLEENARRKAAGKKEIVISPVAMEIVPRIDALFEIERSINGQSADQRKAVRQAQSAPLVADLET